jgi:glycerol-3-phosphate dehydrogenase (NAD(P)+)
MQKEKIAVIGSGSWGLALSLLLNKNGHEVKIWSYSSNECDVLNSARTNKNYLPNIKIPNEIFISCDIKKILYDVNYVLIAVPSKFVKKTLENIFLNANIKEKIIISATKGLCEQKTISKIIKNIFLENDVVVLSGPTHAEEVAKFMPTTCVIACENILIAKRVKKIFANNFFKVYISKDVIGVELGAALKNIVALVVGISDGLKFGDNAKAAIINQGIVEISNLITKFGADAKTFYGLAGVGDLIVTCISEHSRNHRAGFFIGQGFTLKESLEKVHMVVESIDLIKDVKDISNRFNINMPIVSEVNKILYENKPARESILDLLDSLSFIY